MLAVTTRQFDTLDDLQIAAFVDTHQPELAGRMAVDLQRHGLTESARLRAYLRHALQLARAAAIERPEDKRAFCEVAITLGPGFEVGPAHLWAQRVLFSEKWTGTEKVGILTDHIVFGGA